MAYELTIIDASGELEASFVPGLGMIGTSLRHRGEELLHQGRGLAAYAQHGSTFGIPFLHPWANRLSAWEFDLDGQRTKLDPDSPITHRDGPTDTPIHGLLAASPYWTPVDADRDTLTAELDFGAVPEYMAVFPFAHRLRYTATVADAKLTVSLTLMAGSERAVPVSFGFHPYLTLPGSDRAGWQIELPVASQALVDERQIPTGQTVQIAPAELDGPLGDRSSRSPINAAS
jgi:aldose 1-epimerase